ncbi:MAG TPA: hypothetical protein VFI70_10195 [Nitrososphaeraceae archaeon]|nr:hypothetical protein [Nitrososphaeraceae archaeon]
MTEQLEVKTGGQQQQTIERTVEAVGRIFVNLDERYFLLSVKRLLKVRLVE